VPIPSSLYLGDLGDVPAFRLSSLTAATVRRLRLSLAKSDESEEVKTTEDAAALSAHYRGLRRGPS
jgi:hypothetical protein